MATLTRISFMESDFVTMPRVVAWLAVAGAITAEDYRSGLESAGFEQIRVLEQTAHSVADAESASDESDAPAVASMTIRAVKPPLDA